MKGLQDGVSYINIYTTNKKATYQLHQGIFQAWHALELLSSHSIGKLMNDVNEMSNIFNQHMGVDSDEENKVYFYSSLEASARFEVRVRLREAADVYGLTLVH
jgi:hypothetical protein